ncbi:MAG TPA: hypothetical protein VFO93_00845 [Hymenobacter sp.]|uniref:hypothetical protein n=1 Tax=Hymenobacter sp. TaxID=1898978 RepID=UPI002D80565D|nr:hypothetical protein [Hymenobacter sp.]HET9502056.1 hypothetical protein [Hymenobacter sp.]
MGGAGRRPGGPRRWAAALGAGGLLAACSGAHEPRHVASAGSVPVQVAPTANVPALLGVSIDGLRQRLGATWPVPAAVAEALPESRLTLADSATAFRTGGLTLVANYDARSRQVRDLLLLGHHEDSLMGRAHLRPNAPNYLVMPVFYAGNTFRLLGVRVIPTK